MITVVRNRQLTLQDKTGDTVLIIRRLCRNIDLLPSDSELILSGYGRCESQSDSKFQDKTEGDKTNYNIVGLSKEDDKTDKEKCDKADAAAAAKVGLG